MKAIAALLAGVVLIGIGCAPPDEESGAPDEEVGIAASAVTTLPWESLGGLITSAPAAASWAPGRVDVFVRGGTGALHTIAYRDGSWSGWNYLGGIVTSAPAVASWGPGRLDVFVRGSDYKLYHKFYDLGMNAWSDWTSLGGYLTSAPAVASTRPGRLDVFALGADRALYTLSWDSQRGSWDAWRPLGGPVPAGEWLFDPAAARSRDGGGVDIFLVGSNHEVWSKFYRVDSGPAWEASSWTSWGGYATSSPAAASRGAHTDLLVLGHAADGTQPLFVRSADRIGAVDVLSYDYQPLGGHWSTAPGAAAQGPGHVDVFAGAPVSNELEHAIMLPTDLVARFAPRLRFDDAWGYPMSAQLFYDRFFVNHATGIIQNIDPATLSSGTLPTYYQVITCGAQVRIKYWWFYGFQAPCDPILQEGDHNGDWESVVVTLSEDRSSIAAITFEMHGKTYTRLALLDGFEVEEVTHPVVYVGWLSHASHFTQEGGSHGSYQCLPWEEARFNTSGRHMDSWRYLVSLDSLSEPWMVADRQANFAWGEDGVNTHPTTAPPTCSMPAATWDTLTTTWNHSHCKLGHGDFWTFCFLPWGDYVGEHSYGKDYMLPTSDVGLLTYSPYY